MKKISKKHRYDITIYVSLLLALFFIGVSGYSYFSEQSYSFKEILFSEKEIDKPKTEPPKLENINKIELLNNYLADLFDEIKTDQVITYEMIRSWDSYDILDIKYQREIANGYYMYLANIKINNTQAILPTRKNDTMSTSEYVVITLNINIIKDQNNENFFVKSIDIPKNN